MKTKVQSSKCRVRSFSDETSGSAGADRFQRAANDQRFVSEVLVGVCGALRTARPGSGTGSSLLRRQRGKAFTLVELLVVISIIAILAGLLFPVIQGISRNRLRRRAQAEMKKIELAIEVYKDKRNSYPPDNPGNIVSNQLFYELSGMILTNATQIYGTLDGSASLAVSALPAAFGTTSVVGFANASQFPAGEEASKVDKCLPAPKADTVGDVGGLKLLVTSLGWPANIGNPYIPGTTLNPWHYVSTNPTNNPNSYDLWVDVVVGSKTNRICNWSDKPIEL